jgi:uncharacterized repeat protein (TIGR01451 family)
MSTHAGTLCTPNASTSFTDNQNMAFRITNNAAGVNRLYSQCTDLSSESLIAPLNNCPPALANPINGLGLNPSDKLLYGLSPTDSRGIGTHVELSFTAPGDVADIMKADTIKIYKIGKDGGYQDIGTVQSVPETNVAPLHQVVPIVQSAASFNQTADLLLLAYRTNYSSSANIPAGTAQLLYEAPQIVIGKISNTELSAANGGTISTNWTDINTSSDVICTNLLNKFRDDTNLFSTCVVDDFLTGTNEDTAIDNCLTSNPFILDKGIHDFAVSPINDNYYAYDSMTYDDKDVLIEVNSNTNVATCTEFADVGNTTGVLSSLMFSQQNKLVAIFANQATGSWIDVSNGAITALASTVTAAPFGDGSSLPFAALRNNIKGSGSNDEIFKNGFEAIIDPIFANGFEGVGIASIRLDKAGVFNDANSDGLAQVGETIDYSFTITNTGTLDLINVSISDSLISLSGTIPTLAASDIDMSFMGSYTLTQGDIDSGFVSNSATISATEPVSGNNVNADSNNGTPVIINLPRSSAIALIKNGSFNDTNSDGLAQVDETIQYTFRVTNIGNVTLDTITISDPLINVPGLVPTLAPAAMDDSTFSGTYIITQNDIDSGSVLNLATVDALDPSNNPLSVDSNTGVTTVVNLPSTASMSLIKTGSFVDTNSDGSAQAGETVNYSFIVTNTGNLTLNNVGISDPIIAVSGSIASFAPTAIDNTTFTGVYTLSQGDVDNGFVSNLATVSAEDPSANTISADSNNNTPLITNLVSSASISLVKSGTFSDTNGDGLAQVGELIDYSFTIKNTGSLTLSNISITDVPITINGSLTTLAVSATDNTTFTGTYTLTQPDIDNGFVSNSATVNAQDPSANNVSAPSNNGNALITNVPTSATISLTKSGVFVDGNGDGFAQVGETIDYTFNVANTGNLTLSNVTISDPLMAVSGSLASLAVSSADNTTFNGTYTLTPQDIVNGLVSNLATVHASDPSSNAVSSQSNNSTPLIVNLPIFSCPVF